MQKHLPMYDDLNDAPAPELTADEEALLKEMPALTGVGQSRRVFLGQEIGGVVWGIGMALQEATEIDHRYGRIMNPNLQHYHVPVNADIYEIETLFVEEDDTVVNPVGVKGMGELGMVGIPAAIANAVYHATGRRVRELPITPDKLL